MYLVKRVEISYFRSAYKFNIKNCRSLNIISGKNDAGKSNILKALNLFFNNNTDWNNIFDFYTDFSTQRLQQVRKETIKGKQFISIKIEFSRPQNYRQSLPPVFSVTRSWLRDSTKYQETNNLETLANRGLLPSTLETAKRFLAQFLNRIHYLYVPAVKDREYYKELLMILQDRLLSSPIDESAVPLVGNLASHIENQIGQLQNDFMRATNLETIIEPPQELASLFQSFLVSTKMEGGNMPLFYRGDGIQARYVPSVLHYISSSSNDFFIWGFEEPENSLEYPYVISLADDFKNLYSKDAQIFISTHSPAIIALDSDDVACYRVYKINELSEISQVHSESDTMDRKQNLLHEMGILEIQKEMHKEYEVKLTERDAQIKQLQDIENERKVSGRPLLLVEGKYDKVILETVWDILYEGLEIPFNIRIADPAANTTGGGAAGADSLKNMIEALHPDEGKKSVALFDFDEKGIKCFQKLSKNFKLDSILLLKAHVNGLAYALLLPPPDYRQDYMTEKIFTIEFMFPDEVIFRQSDDSEGLILEKIEPSIHFGKCKKSINEIGITQLSSLLSEHFPPVYRIVAGKDIFAEIIVKNCTPEECNSFKPLFEILLYIFNKY